MGAETTIATIEAELRAEVATAQIIRFDMREACEHQLRDEGTFWLDLCLTPRPAAQACYPKRWGAQRFERIGDLFFVPPGEVLRARSECGKQISIVCRLQPELIEKWFDGELKWTDARLEAALDIRDQSIRCLLMRTTREVSHPGFASEMILELIASQLAIELGRYCASVKQSAAKRGMPAWRLKLIDERVQELGKAPSLTELAKLCNLSVRQLSRGFRVSRGCSIGHYVEQSRVEQAKRLLISGNSVKEVAYSLGFASLSSFSYAFRRATGACPRQFRRLA